MKTYDVLLADPPWPYNARNNPATKFGRGTHGHYASLSWDELEQFPMRNFANPEGSLLFLWATGPYLHRQIRMAETWGFRFCTVGFVWVKTNPNKGNTFAGPGFYTSSNAEFCLLFRYGLQALAPLTKLVNQVVTQPRQRHSAKPVEIHERIEKMYPPGNFSHIELFARTRRPGWDAMGYEVTGELWKP